MASETYELLRRMVEDHLLRYLPETDPESRVLYDAMKYSLMAGGKRVRPVLLLASCVIAGGTAEEALPYACALEFIHTYSLIHDDHPSMDNDDLRRGKPTNHKVFGDDMAILAGDGLLNSAMDVMFDDIDSAMRSGAKEDVARRVRAARVISRAAGVRGMVAGQAADVRPLEMGTDAPAGLLYIHRHKTGALLRAAVRAGALLGGAGGAALAGFTTYGEQVGIAFQIIDDILDIEGDAAELGKNTGMDAGLGKLTYPAVYGVEESHRRARTATEKACEAIGRIETTGEVSGGSPSGKRTVSSDFLKEMALDLLERIS